MRLTSPSHAAWIQLPKVLYPFLLQPLAFLSATFCCSSLWSQALSPGVPVSPGTQAMSPGTGTGTGTQPYALGLSPGQGTMQGEEVAMSLETGVSPGVGESVSPGVSSPGVSPVAGTQHKAIGSSGNVPFMGLDGPVTLNGLQGAAVVSPRMAPFEVVGPQYENLGSVFQHETLWISNRQDLLQRVESLEMSLESALLDQKKNAEKQKEQERQAKAQSDKPDSSDKKKVAESESSDKWTVKLGGHIQMDYITWARSDPAIVEAQNYFNYRRLRLVADGTGYHQFDFRLQMTLEPGDGLNVSPQASPDVKDAYVSMNEIPGIGRFRIGNFFVPFSLEQVTNDTNNIFNERSIPTQNIFSADREVGMAVYNCTPDQNLSWAGGLFFHDISDTMKTRFRDSQGYRLSGRINWLPFYDEASKGRYLVHTGVGVLHTKSFNDQLRFRARPQVQRGPILIDSGFLDASSNTTGNVELACIWGPVTLQSEAFLSQVNLIGDSVAHVGGAYGHLSYFLTGENRMYDRFGQHGAQFGRNKPFSNFSARKGSFSPGAWEAKIRWSLLDLMDVDSGQYNDLSLGFNWYWSDRTRIMFDWIRPYTSRDTVFGSTQSDLIAMRFDVNW